MTNSFIKHLERDIEAIHEAGLYKPERVITSSQSADIAVSSGDEVLNFCANNYLGLANNPHLVEAARESLERYGFGMASVRFICGTLDIHKELESKISTFLGQDDTILYSLSLIHI